MRRRRPQRRAFPVVLSALVLLLPPGLRLLDHYGLLERLDAWLGLDGDESVATETIERKDSKYLQNEVASLRRQLEETKRALARVSGLRFLEDEGRWSSSRYQLAWVDVLPVADPSPSRNTLWVWPSVALSLEKDSPVVFGDALVGRLIGLSPGSRAGRVQTLLDPVFRVRFQSGESAGILWGTAQVDHQNRPLLEVHHLTPTGTLPVGAKVFTGGGDRIYPPGILIGEVVGDEGKSASSRTLVRAAIHPRDELRLVVIRDLARRALGRGGERRWEVSR